MKIFKNGEVYVQAYDVAELNKFSIPYPSTILPERFDTNDYNIYFCEGRMFLRFTDPIEVEYFKTLDWIIDFDKMKNKSLTEIKDILNKLKKKQAEQSSYFMNISSDDRVKIAREYSAEMRKLHHMTTSLEILLAYKQKYINIELPFNVEESHNEKPAIKRKTRKKDVK